MEPAVRVMQNLYRNRCHVHDVANVRLHVEVGLRPPGVVGVGVNDGRLVKAPDRSGALRSADRAIGELLASA
jgi:hypothetical protein